ncbi:hypothetical protein ACX40Y_15380 [Sphingomonas sp. RS6]
MKRDRPWLIALALAGGWAIVLPVMLLLPHHRPADAQRLSAAVKPLSTTPVPPIAHVYDRALFSSRAGGGDTLPPDAPQLSGIVGRLGSDAVALVRTGEGATRTLAIGESVDGWRLESLSIDAALFVRGGERARVPLPGDDAAPPATDQ